LILPDDRDLCSWPEVFTEAKRLTLYKLSTGFQEQSTVTLCTLRSGGVAQKYFNHAVILGSQPLRTRWIFIFSS
jgi:hypothetical protein